MTVVNAVMEVFFLSAAAVVMVSVSCSLSLIHMDLASALQPILLSFMGIHSTRLLHIKVIHEYTLYDFILLNDKSST